MTPYGSDRVRLAAGKVILHSALAKGWTPRVPKIGTHSEHPGTAVLWDDQYYEVLTAEATGGGAVRYVLAPWEDHRVMRTVEPYSAESEAALAAEYRRVARQQRLGVMARLLGLFAGHLPAPVQNRLSNELGVSPSAMTITSCLLPLAVVSGCIWVFAGAQMEQRLSPIPAWLWPILLLLLLETGVRFYVAMSQSRGMGSAAGFLLYAAFWGLVRDRSRYPSPFTEPGDALFTLEPSAEIELRDALETRGMFLGLLPAAEQRRLQKTLGFDYRRNSIPFAWVILACSIAGAVTSGRAVAMGGGMGSFLSLLAAAGLAVEQVRRLAAFKRGPSGSVLSVFVKPFVRRFLERR